MNFLFVGFNGLVVLISKVFNGNIIFGGSFMGLGNVSVLSMLDG